MKNSAVVILTCSQQQRVQRIYQDYVVTQKLAHIEVDPINGTAKFNHNLTCSLHNIQKRLGGKLFNQLHQIMHSALQQNSEELHKQWIAELLKHYYDPMYSFQIEKKSNKIIFKGNETEIKEYFNKLE
jgi:tRNA 2-selenouridine synthase